MKIATLALHDMDYFLDGIEKALRTRHEARRFIIRTHGDMAEAMDWADAAWCEFAAEHVAIASELNRKPVVVKLHSYEAFDIVRRIQWQHVAHLVHSATHVLDIAHDTDPRILDVPTTLIPNGVDTEVFALQPHDGSRKRIGTVAWVRPEKTPPMWLQVLHRLHEVDSEEWTLHIAGPRNHPGMNRYLDHIVPLLGLQDSVFFDGFVDDIPTWWADKDYTLSASTRESCPYNVSEAMACGVKPVVHWFWGADESLPKSALWRTVDEAVQILADPAPWAGSDHRDMLTEMGCVLAAQADRLCWLMESVV